MKPLSSPGGGQANQPQLDYMRNNRPQRATPRQIVQILPSNYVDPEPSGGYDGYARAATLPENETGWASNKVGRVGDPTIGNAVTGSQSNDRLIQRSLKQRLSHYCFLSWSQYGL